MPFDPHERARFLIDESRIAGISSEQSLWLHTHLSGCRTCSQHEQLTGRVLSAFVAHASACTIDTPVDGGRPKQRWRWPLAAAAVLLLAAIPLLRSTRDARQDESDALLLERVGNHVSRTVPQALEPLMHPESGVQQ